MKVLTALLLPPGLFVIALLILSFLCVRLIARIISLTLAGLIYLLSIEPIKDAILMPLEMSSSVPKSPSGDAIVVLGGGSYTTGVLKEDSLKRLLTGFTLHRELNLPLILSGGASLGSLPDAEIMLGVLTSLGIDSSKILIETKSKNTFQNASEVSQICKKHGFKNIILVTSAYHMPRAQLAFQKSGINIQPYPTDFKSDRRYNIYSFIPRASVLSESTKALREHIALIYYKYLIAGGDSPRNPP
ncbi:MAG: YdcF family protein [Aquificaceae bacterium]|nr:YdcF family protein [Aquificaceae bacterium]MDW8237645.1 YdcF family protein [Aquificaceae bacterium]